jgi:rhomboid protease GluP
MPSTDRELLTDVLRACYEAAPKPLYAGQFAQQRGLDRAVLDRALDELRLKGLLRLTEWVQDMGQGYTLTHAGLALLENPRGLRPGAPIPTASTQVAESDDDADERPPPALIRPGPPIVSYALIGVNVAVFFLGMYLADRAGIPATKYLDGILGPIDHFSLRPDRVLHNGEWWRIITYAFLHGGLLHIALNMYALYVLGPLLESLWGSGRLLLLYMVAAVTGGCVVIWTDRAAVGASGAISGMLTSLGVWVMLNRAHLPPALASGLTRMVMINLVILAVVSMQSGVSWEGHLGGAVGGALASFPLQVSRHGGTWRSTILGTLGTLLVAAVFLVLAYGRNWGVLPQF